MSVWFILLLLHIAIIDICTSYPCTNGDDMTCSLGGKCVNNICLCDPTWKGENCEMLDLLPSNDYKAFYREYESSWGGSVIYSSNDSLYHMYVSDMAYNCTLHEYGSNSQVIHITSKQPQGPYTYNYDKSGSYITIPIWAHEPTVQYIQKDDIYIIYHIGYGNRTSGFVNCTGNFTTTKCQQMLTTIRIQIVQLLSQRMD